MSLKISKKSIINIMIICIPLCPYKLFSIEDKDISAIFVIWGFLILIGLCDVCNLMRSIKRNWITVIAIIYFGINTFILNNKNYGSIIQFILLWIILLLSYRRVTEYEFQKNIDLFHKVMNIMALYGIYEFFGRILHLPLSDPWIEGLMVRGYNWYNSELIGSLVIYRSNGIFVEPSMFSQYLSINILLYLFAGKKNKKNTKAMLVSICALMCSFSGTGLLLLILGSIVFIMTKGGITVLLRTIKKYKLWIGLFLFFSIMVLVSPVGNYMLSRLTEFDPTNTKSISGYIRFIGQFNIASEIWESNALFGIGIGNVQPFIDAFRMTGSATAFASLACSMILARYAAELGGIGVIILIFTYKGFIRKERIRNLNYKILLICVLIMIPLCDSGISVSYWLLLYLINIDFLPQNKLKEVGYGK